MSFEQSSQDLTEIEVLPGEMIHDVIARSVQERAKTDFDLILRLEVMGVMKEVVITESATRESISKALSS